MLGFVFLCVQQVFGEKGYLKLRARQREVRQLEQELRRLTEENQRLQRQIQRLRTDPAAIERVAREEMKLVRPGEVIYTVPARPSPAPAEPRSARPTR